MSKSILIIDTPTNCFECPCLSEDGFCRVENEYRPCTWARPEWCPLKEEVKAIPIEWIKKWASINYIEGEYSIAVDMIEDWKEENKWPQ